MDVKETFGILDKPQSEYDRLKGEYEDYKRENHIKVIVKGNYINYVNFILLIFLLAVNFQPSLIVLIENAFKTLI
jgi:hypothetical protein